MKIEDQEDLTYFLNEAINSSNMSKNKICERADIQNARLNQYLRGERVLGSNVLFRLLKALKKKMIIK